MQHLSNRLDAAQVAQFCPTVIARVVAVCSRGAVGGDYADYLTREALIDAWCELHGCNRAQAITDLVAIQISGDVVQGRGRTSNG